MNKFSVGKLVMTGRVNDRVAGDILFARFVTRSLGRHKAGDWGNISEEDRKENDLSLQQGFRLLSAYEELHLPKIWIITEADRSVTTILFPNEY